MKKVNVCIVLCIILFVLMFGIGHILGQPCGDTNSDGKIDIIDALLIAQFSVGGSSGNFDQGAGDVNGDGNINILDALLISQFSVGIIDQLPCQSTAESDYTYGVNVSGSTATVWLNSNVNTTWVDLHYILNSQGQLNYRMESVNDNFNYIINNVNDGDVINFFFTYNNNSLAYDTPWYSYKVGSDLSTTGVVITSTPDTTTPTSNDGYRLVWSDEFNGTGRPDTANWNYHIGNGWNPGLNEFHGWGNGEWEWYQPGNCSQANGSLDIVAYYNNTPMVIEGREWYQTSGRMTTQGLRSWKYGRIEARMKLPNASGAWPAFWMLGESSDCTYKTYDASVLDYDIMASNWSSCGEIDIMEHKNYDSETCTNLFWDTRVGLFPWEDGVNENNPTWVQVGDVSQYHLYTLEWTADSLKWYIDRETNPNPVKVMDITPELMEEFRKPFYIIMNLAIGGSFVGTEPDKSEFPLHMYVDYVRVWQ